MTEEQTFRDIYKKLSLEGKITSPRGLKVLEIENFSYEFPPYCRFISFDARKLSIDYIKREFQWYLKGDNQDLSICEHAKLWTKMVTDRGTINSNYGFYIFGGYNQFEYAKNTLIEDKDSRRAAIMILNPSHTTSSDADRPCTYSINFRIRENKLNMTVRMRSQDAIYGMGNDIPSFSFIHEMMWLTLKEKYPELEYGNYFHSSDSFHIYEKHFQMLSEICTDSGYSIVDCPKISGKEEVDFLKRMHFTKEKVPENYLFTRWLITIKN